MRKGRIILDYESDELGRCNFNITQESKEELDEANLISLFEYVIRELLPNDFQFQ